MTVLAADPVKEKASAQKTWVFLFDELDKVEATAKPKDWEDVRSLLGGKGANLFEMTRLGLPVPPGFTVTTEACNGYLAANHEFPTGMWDQEVVAMHEVEKKVGKNFGDPKNPLFVSCRSGAKFSMPGMMDTVLNIGLNDETAKGMIELTGDPRFVYDSYRRLIQMFGSVVMGVADEPFEEAIAEQKKKRGVRHDVELTAEDWQVLVEKFKTLVKAYKGQEFPQDPYKQLEMATRAVFNSWFGKRAIDYRNATNISHDLGTAVNIVTMVFGNMGNDSAHRRGLHPQPGRRHEGTVRRLPDQRPGRRRGGRHPQHPAHHAAQAGHARGLRPVPRHRHQAREPLPGHAGRGVHDRAQEAVDAPDPQRQAHGPCRHQDGRGHEPTKV